MNKDTIVGALVGLSILAAAGFLLAPDPTKDEPPSKNPPDQIIDKAGAAVTGQTPKQISKESLSVQLDVSALLDVDGTTLIPVKYEPDGGITKYDAFPCVWRAAGAQPSDCMRVIKGKSVDFGDENTFLASESTGPACVPRPCVLPSGSKTP